MSKCFRLFAVLAVAVSLAPTVSAQGWPFTRWAMTCQESARDWLETQTGDADLHCDGTQRGGLAHTLELDMQAGSEWLERLGFLAPDVAPDTSGEAYQFLFAGLDDPFVAGGYSPSPGQLTLNPAFLRMSGRWEVLAEAARFTNRNREGAHMHEVFHAVQASYFLGSEAVDRSALPLWIMEGTAEWVGQAWAQKKGYAVTMGTRLYDVPLHRPNQGHPGGVGPLDYYRTSQFWEFVGTYLTSEDGVAYLRDLFKESLAASDGLPAVDDVLARLNLRRREGLSDVFTAFIAQTATDATYRQVTPWTLDGLGERTVAIAVQPVAAAASRLQVQVPESDDDHRLSISLDGDHADLHLIVDGARQDLGPGPRNEFRQRLPAGTHTFSVTVVNVAGDAEASIARDVTIRAVLEAEEDANCESTTYAASAEFTVSGPDGEIEMGGQRLPSPVGQYRVFLPFERLRVTTRDRSLDYYPAASVLTRRTKTTLYMRSPSLEEIQAIRDQPGVQVEGEITTAVPEETDLDTAWNGPLGHTGQFVTDTAPGFGSNALSFSLGEGGVRSGVKVSIEVGAVEPGTYQWDGSSFPQSPAVRISGGEGGIPPLNHEVSVTIQEVKPGKCARGTFSGGIRFEDSGPPIYRVEGRFFVKAPPEAQR